ncbi:FtsK/SpoIIIE domain-containing protein [Streptomyces uncialis]|uniref:FtsK/SpoIIIE domain-containing protein n=1 Tax=Streptomyces uncialis TaxID=1048205 RepID=UPI00225B4953|nr:FtsK/SpoIIIE domain-containing protein [Streptomyces uncialis]MCX4665042.1 FtsK/SpoIIIE domain-containing protein [Streptomyces uncialis]
MGKKSQAGEDAYGQAAGAIGGLAITFGGLAAVKDRLNLSWPATVLLTAGALVALGYGAWWLRTTAKRLWTRQAQPVAALREEAPAASSSGDETAQEAPAHPELTAALGTAGAIARDQIIRDREAQVTDAGTGTFYDFLMPEGRTYEDVEKRIGVVAGMFGVTRLHMKVERSRDNERRVKFLKLHEPPFSHAFPAPTLQEVKTFAGVPFGHDVTGQLAGVSTLDKASVLVAGMTQTGKTTLVNGIITCLLIAYREFELYLLDGKFCGLTRFEPIAVRYESSDDPAVFENMVDELNDRSDKRYMQNRQAIQDRKPAPKFTPVFFIVDEAADFFAHDESKEGKERARRIAEKTRSLVAKSLESGISTLLMTQRPSTNAIPVVVREQFLYRLCLYVASSGTARVALGDTYFETIAPINPALLDPDVKGQAVLFANGRSTLIRGFNFEDDFVWDVVDEVQARQQKALQKAPQSPLKQAISLMQNKGAEFMPTAELAPALGVVESDPVERGKKLSRLLGIPADQGKGTKGVRGYHLTYLTAAAMSGS